jgi:hypothetical protein
VEGAGDDEEAETGADREGGEAKPDAEERESEAETGTKRCFGDRQLVAPMV